jgi:hypothetical protein
VTSFSFRNPRFAPDGNTIVSAAPLDLAAPVYGAAGLHESGGYAFRHNEEMSDHYLGVLGARILPGSGFGSSSRRNKH